MGLSTYEIMDNLEELARNFKAAVTTSSAGGQTITKSEAVGIAVNFFKKLGIDVIDSEDEPSVPEAA